MKTILKTYLAFILAFNIVSFVLIKAADGAEGECKPTVEIWTMQGCQPCQIVKGWEGELKRAGATVIERDVYQFAALAAQKNVNSCPTIYAIDCNGVDKGYWVGASDRTKTNVLNWIKAESETCRLTQPKAQGPPAIGPNIQDFRTRPKDEQAPNQSLLNKLLGKDKPQKENLIEPPNDSPDDFGFEGLPSIGGNGLFGGGLSIVDDLKAELKRFKTGLVVSIFIAQFCALCVFKILCFLFGGFISIVKRALIRARNAVNNALVAFSETVVNHLQEVKKSGKKVE